MNKQKTQEHPVDFEKSLAELEAVVEKLEHGDLGLEESLRLFESGVKLTRICQGALQVAEQRVEQLLEKNGDLEVVPFKAEPGE